MPMGTPTDLSPSAHYVGEQIGCGPWIGMFKDRVYLILCSVIDAQTFLKKTLVDEGLEILRAFRAGRCHMISQLIGKVLTRARSVGKNARVPKVVRISLSELCVTSDTNKVAEVGHENSRLAVANPPVSWSLVPTTTPSVLSFSRKSSTLANALS